MQLTTGGGSNAMESVDGKTVYYQISSSVWRVGTDGSGNRVVFDDVSAMGLALTSDGIYYATTAASKEVRFYGFASGSSRTVRKMTRPWSLGLTVSPDQKWLLYTQQDTDATGDLMLVDPFR